MNTEFENIRGRMPYTLSEQEFDRLQERILSRTTTRPERLARRIPLRRICLAATGVVLLGLVAAVFFTERHPIAPAKPAANVEQLLQSAPDETVIRAAAENYDDILINQQL